MFKEGQRINEARKVVIKSSRDILHLVRVDVVQWWRVWRRPQFHSVKIQRMVYHVRNNFALRVIEVPPVRADTIELMNQSLDSE